MCTNCGCSEVGSGILHRHESPHPQPLSQGERGADPPSSSLSPRERELEGACRTVKDPRTHLTTTTVAAHYDTSRDASSSSLPRRTEVLQVWQMGHS